MRVQMRARKRNPWRKSASKGRRMPGKKRQAMRRRKRRNKRRKILP